MTSKYLLSAAAFRRFAVAVIFSGGIAVLPAATLTFDSSLHVQPDEQSAVIATLPAGTSLSPLPRDQFTAAGVTNLPPGWVPLRHSGTFQGFVSGVAVGAASAIPPGTAIHAAPDAASPVIHTVAPTETLTATPSTGEWSAVSFQAELLVYANAVPLQSRRRVAPEPAPTPVAESAAPVPPAPEDSAALRARLRERDREAAATPVLTNATPRVFTGFLTRTRRIFGRGAKFDYQLVDAENRRIVLLDFTSLMLTSPLDAFEGKWVSVYGPGLTRADTKDVIIRVETLRLVR